MSACVKSWLIILVEQIRNNNFIKKNSYENSDTYIS